ncbi:MAG: AmmeMemoRadiSam system protein B, partial [Planctomycetota bacterium]
MEKQFERPLTRDFLLGLITLALGVSAVLLWKVHLPPLAAAAEKKDVSKKETPAEPAGLVLRSSLAGSWYKADPKKLNKQFDGFFRKADAKPIEDVIALILPHAGYDWSGQTAAFGLKTVEKQYKRI